MVNIKAVSLFLLPLLAYAAPVLTTDENGLQVSSSSVDKVQPIYVRDESFDIDLEQVFDSQKRDSLSDDIYNDIQERKLKKPKPAVIAPSKPAPKEPGVKVKPLKALPKPNDIPKPKKSDELLVHHPSPADVLGKGKHHKRDDLENDMDFEKRDLNEFEAEEDEEFEKRDADDFEEDEGEEFERRDVDSGIDMDDEEEAEFNKREEFEEFD
ncbi:hypothetical protein VHEMI09176 [[Torrubiella] hemipterigena]|uniref:Uncharacterized protein n=1 Tax=[Torrubiella] hemipterigena TaxID=1531966 RepID=A0A0A1TPV7_9HYPO|nr:hypothetical protein VHEMI09176 [[Torrubiella] hemipterigena]